NKRLDWLNCGVDGAGWVPPPITLENLVYKDLATVLQEDHNPFSSCAPYLDIFQRLSSETGVPTIFLASIALQESGCNPSVTGGATEVGMMQITPDKCPSDGSDCYDPEINIGIGARYFKTVLDQNNGNLAAAMGNYNGWYFGLTVALANNYAVCAQHNNLDYLQNVFNGYLQGVDPSSLNMGIYHNTC
ncbi:glycoside hydrolase family 23 protein, partial [Serendipita vermifera MAFF 305830]